MRNCSEVTCRFSTYSESGWLVDLRRGSIGAKSWWLHWVSWHPEKFWSNLTTTTKALGKLLRLWIMKLLEISQGRAMVGRRCHGIESRAYGPHEWALELLCVPWVGSCQYFYYCWFCLCSGFMSRLCLSFLFFNSLFSCSVISYKLNLNAVANNFNNEVYGPSAYQLIIMFTHISGGETSFLLTSVVTLLPL